MLKVTIKGATAAELLANILALAASMGVTAPTPKTSPKKSDAAAGGSETPKPDEKKDNVTGGSTVTSTSSSAPAITLADLQALGSKIQGHKTKNPEEGAKAVAEFKEVVTKAGATRLSDPNLSADKFPSIKTALEAIVTKYSIV